MILFEVFSEEVSFFLLRLIASAMPRASFLSVYTVKDKIAAIL